MKFCDTIAAIFAAGTPNVGEAIVQSPILLAEEIADKLSAVKKPKVAWLQLQEHTGRMESVLCSGGTTAEGVVLNLVSVDYNEPLMVSPGHVAEKALDDMNAEDHILVANGSIPTNENGAYRTTSGKSAEQVLPEAAEGVTVILVIGACAVWGSVQAAKSNSIGARRVDEIIEDKPVINVSGCPPIGEVIMAILTYVLTYGKAPEVDAEGRPRFVYNQHIHDSCLRHAYFDVGQSMKTFDGKGVRDGQHLYEVGRKGPSMFSSYPIVQWSLRSGWSIGAGYPYISCTEKDSFDQLTPFCDKLSGTLDTGIGSNVSKVGVGLLAATTVGAVVHGGLTLVKELKIRCSSGEEKMSTVFDSVEGRGPPMADPPPDSPGAQSETAPDSKSS